MWWPEAKAGNLSVFAGYLASKGWVEKTAVLPFQNSLGMLTSGYLVNLVSQGFISK